MKFLIEYHTVDYPLFHKHTDYELYVVVSGAGMVQTRFADVRASQGSVIIIPPMSSIARLPMTVALSVYA